jgi:hypothetical protein
MLLKSKSWLLSIVVIILCTSFNVMAQSVMLKNGWNLISLPAEPSSTEPGAALSSIGGKYSVVYSFNTAANTYQRFIPGDASNTLTELHSGIGYWIFMTQSATLDVSGSAPRSSVNLLVGWNLVGHLSTQDMPIQDALQSINGKYNAVYAFDTVKNEYVGYIPGSSSPLTEIEVGRGYWIHATQAATWTIGSTPTPTPPSGKMLPLRVSANGHYFETSDGKPYFVAGDTAYFLAKESTRQVVDDYFKDCAQRGINVIFMSFVHRYNQPNHLGDHPWQNGDASKIITTPGNNPNNSQEYDYWDHVDYIVDKSEQYNLYLFMMPLFVTG